jgi:hypothetical protein
VLPAVPDFGSPENVRTPLDTVADGFARVIETSRLAIAAVPIFKIAFPAPASRAVITSVMRVLFRVVA